MIDPKCLDGRIPMFYSATGYMLPCCYCEKSLRPEVNDERIMKLLVKKVSELDSIQELLETDEWKEFYDKLLTDPPKVCRDHCKKGFGKTRTVINNDI